MPYDIEKTYTSFGGGISDDDFLGTTNSVKDLNGIDVQTQERYAQAMGTFSGLVGEYTLSGGVSWIKETPSSFFTSNYTSVQNFGTAITLPAAAYGCESYGTGIAQVNYFFLSDRIVAMNYNGTAQIGSDIVVNYPGITVSPALGWHVTNLLFSKDDKIYFLDTTNKYINTTSINTTVGATNASTTITTNDTTGWTRGAIITGTGIPASTTIVSIVNNTSAIISNSFTGTTGNVSIKIGRDIGVLQLMPGSIVKYIYSYSYDSTIVVATNGGNTYIYELEFTGGGYNLVRKLEIQGYLCTYAIGDGYNVYWTTNDSIHQYQGGQSQMIKKLSIPNTKGIEYNKVLLIGETNSLYRFGAIKPGRNSVLTKSNELIDFISKNFILKNFPAGGYKIYGFQQTTYKRTNTIELLPLDGGIFQIPKQDLSFRFGYHFGFGTYINPATRQTIVVNVKTDGMLSYVEVARVTDGNTTDSIGNKRYGYMEINPDMIVTALSGYTTEFGYVSVRIDILSGDEYTSPAGYYRKTPQIFDFTCKANFVKR